MKRIIKRALFLALVRFDLAFIAHRCWDRWDLFVERANEVLWPEFDGEGTGGEAFWPAVMGGK